MSSSSTILNLANCVYLHGHTQPERTALVVGDETYSYERFATIAGRVATWLRGCVRTHGQGGARAAAEGTVNGNRGPTGPRVGVLAARSIETYAGIVGTAWAGGTYVPLNPKQPAARLSCAIER